MKSVTRQHVSSRLAASRTGRSQAEQTGHEEGLEKPSQALTLPCKVPGEPEELSI